MHKFSPQQYQKLESSERYEILQPEKTLRRFGLKEGMTFVDIGAGTGFFSRAAATIVGSEGKVYAVDTSGEMLEAFRSFGVPPNVVLIQSEEYHIPLTERTADFVLVAFVAHEVQNLPRFLGEIVRLTKPEGKVAFIEWKKQADSYNPPESERLAETALKEILTPYMIVEQGELNPFHYYSIISVAEKERN